jgi:hypothetical protein
MADLALTQEHDDTTRLHNLYDQLRKDEHKARFLNHLFALVFSTILTGLISHWAMEIMSVCYAANGPLTAMEFIDYIGKI